MIFKSSEKLTDPRFVGYRSLGFGRNINLTTNKIELTINLSDIPEHSLKQANNFIQQCKDLSLGWKSQPKSVRQIRSAKTHMLVGNIHTA